MDIIGQASADRKALYIMCTVGGIGNKCMYCDPQGENLSITHMREHVKENLFLSILLI
jgi:hypothetical protein